MELNRPKVEDFKPGDFPDSELYDVCELKFDGIWGQLLLEDDKWEIWSRSGLLKKSGKLSKCWSRTLIHSEFLWAQEWSKDRPELYRKLAVFGAEMIHGDDVTHLSYTYLREVLGFVLRELSRETIENGLFLVQSFSIDEAKALWEDQVELQKYEGLMFKKSSGDWNYGIGRMKQIATMDYVCMDVIESTSVTYAGWGAKCIIGGLYDNGELVEKCRVPGMTDEQRREFLQNKDKYIGQVFESKGKKITKKGAIRHPEFTRWRDDKLPEECTWAM